MEGKSQEWFDITEARIREVFDLFDKDKTESIVQEEVGTIMRALGAYPSERALVLEILPAMQVGAGDTPGDAGHKHKKKHRLQYADDITIVPILYILICTALICTALICNCNDLY